MMTERISLPEGVPPLTQYYVYLTTGCNLACQHCWISPVYQPKGTTGGHLDYELFKLAIEEGIPLGLQGVKLTGGEPLLHPDFLRFVDLLKEKKLGLTIETNATLMTPEVARHLKEKSTLGHISVSIDGANSASHDSFRGVPGAFDKAVTGIKMLVEVGYHPQVIMSIHPGNVNEIEELVKMGQGLGASSIKFNLIQPTGRGKIMTDREQVLNIKRLIDIGRWVEKDLQKRISIPLIYGWPMAFFGHKRLIMEQTSACNVDHILGILATGHLAMCGIGTQERELVYGKLRDDKVREVWVNNFLLNQVRETLLKPLEGICGQCIHGKICLGSCLAQNYYANKRLTASFWFCQIAEENNFFPNSRKYKSDSQIQILDSKHINLE